VPHSDPRFVVCTSPGLKGAKAFRVTKIIAGSERILVVTYNPNLAKTQWMTLQNDVAKASKRLSELQGRLAGRAAGLIKGGKRPTLASVEQKCRSILRRQHLKDAIQVTIEGDPKGHPQLRPTVGRTAGSGDPRRTKSGDLRRTSTRHSSLATRHLSLVRAGSPDPPVLCDRRSPSHRPSARHLETFGRQNGGVGRPSPNETNSQRKQPGSEGGQDQLCSMPEGGSTEDFASINRGPPDHDRRARVSMDRSIFLVRVVAALAGAAELAERGLGRGEILFLGGIAERLGIGGERLCQLLERGRITLGRVVFGQVGGELAIGLGFLLDRGPIGRLALQSRLERGQGGFFPLVQGIHDLFDRGRGFIIRASAHDAGNHQQAHHARCADQVSHQILLTTFQRGRSADRYSSVPSEHSDGRKATVLDRQSL